MKLNLQIDNKHTITIKVEDLPNNRKIISVPLDVFGCKKTKKAIDILRNIDNDWLNKRICIKKREDRKNKLSEIWKSI